jgi:CRP-like cAMP-binding protein
MQDAQRNHETTASVSAPILFDDAIKDDAQDAIPEGLLASQRIRQVHDAGFHLGRIIDVAKDSELFLPEDTDLRVVVSGWACYQHLIADGRRQILDILLPGDVIWSDLFFARPFRSPVALTPVRTCSLTPGDACEPDRLFRIATERFEQRLADHLLRIGQMDSAERLIDLFRALHDRLAEVGMAGDGRFGMPLPQKILADVLGMSAIHVSRTTSQLKSEGVIRMERSVMTLHEAALAPRTRDVAEKCDPPPQPGRTIGL